MSPPLLTTRRRPSTGSVPTRTRPRQFSITWADCASSRTVSPYPFVYSNPAIVGTWYDIHHEQEPISHPCPTYPGACFGSKTRTILTRAPPSRRAALSGKKSGVWSAAISRSASRRLASHGLHKLVNGRRPPVAPGAWCDLQKARLQSTQRPMAKTPQPSISQLAGCTGTVCHEASCQDRSTNMKLRMCPNIETNRGRRQDQTALDKPPCREMDWSPLLATSDNIDCATTE